SRSGIAASEDASSTKWKTMGTMIVLFCVRSDLMLTWGWRCRYNLYCRSPSSLHFSGSVGSFLIASSRISIVEQRWTVLWPPFSCAVFSVFNGLSCALVWKENTEARRIVGKRRSLFKGVLLDYDEWLSVECNVNE